jgi:hypothetical protein
LPASTCCLVFLCVACHADICPLTILLPELPCRSCCPRPWASPAHHSAKCAAITSSHAYCRFLVAWTAGRYAMPVHPIDLLPFLLTEPTAIATSCAQPITQPGASHKHIMLLCTAQMQLELASSISSAHSYDESFSRWSLFVFVNWRHGRSFGILADRKQHGDHHLQLHRPRPGGSCSCIAIASGTHWAVRVICNHAGSHSCWRHSSTTCLGNASYHANRNHTSHSGSAACDTYTFGIKLCEEHWTFFIQLVHMYTLSLQ